MEPRYHRPVILGTLHHSWRVLARTPGFTLAAVGALSLGISASVAIFSVVDAVMLRPLPYSHPAGLALASSLREPFSYPRFQVMEEKSRSFEAVGAFTSEVFNLTGQGAPEQLAAARVSWQFFQALGTRPILGRAFRSDDDRPGARDVTLLTYRFWARRFGSRADIIGQSVTLGGRDFTIIGVLPDDFRFAPMGADVDVWAAKVFELSLTTPSSVQAGAGFLTAVARLRPGVDLARAQAEQDTLGSQYRAAYPNHPDSDPRLRIEVAPLQRAIAADLRPALFLLLAAVGLLLLIACANVANLLLSRAAARAGEMAVRTALGASRAAIVRQLLTESLLLAMAGGAVGLAIASWGTQSLVSLSHSAALELAGAKVDSGVALFALVISVASSVLCGLAPALHLSKPDLYAALREAGRTPIGTRGRWARGTFVVVQVSLSVVLLVASGLLLRSLIRLRTNDPGFRSDGVLTMRIALPVTRYNTKPALIHFYEQVLDAAQTVPGVRAVAISSALPLDPTRLSPALMEGQPAVPLAQRPVVHIQTISPDYGAVLGVPLLRGRRFTPHDDAQAPVVAIVNQKLANRFWPGEEAIGKRIWIGRLTTPAQVVGVFGDVKNQALASSSEPEIMLPFPQLPWPLLHLSLRTSLDPHSLAAGARERVLTIDKDQSVTDVRTLEERMAAAGAQPRFHMFLLGVFSAAALLIAVVGVYGVTAYSAAQRTREMGLRIALGASRRDILALASRQTLRLVMAGIALGLAAALTLTRLMAGFLYGTSATDPLAFTAAPLLFAVAGALATYIPALRAARVDPCQSLRHE
ncbi:MAG TPA: ABC transporter permease [Bryobacteraceae bacterium]|nr:ABC transporter permease [Bryobacteraceae bacterium]